MTAHLSIPRQSSFALSTISSRDERDPADVSDRGVDDVAERDSVFMSASSTTVDDEDAGALNPAVDNEDAMPPTIRHQPLQRQQTVISSCTASQVSVDGRQNLTAHLTENAETSQVGPVLFLISLFANQLELELAAELTYLIN